MASREFHREFQVASGNEYAVPGIPSSPEFRPAATAVTCAWRIAPTWRRTPPAGRNSVTAGTSTLAFASRPRRSSATGAGPRTPASLTKRALPAIGVVGEDHLLARHLALEDHLDDHRLFQDDRRRILYLLARKLIPIRHDDVVFLLAFHELPT
jgi:hypothetical protein